MILNNKPSFFPTLFLSAYLSVWYGGLLPHYLEAGYINYFHTGIFGAILLLTGTLILYFNIAYRKWFATGILALSAVILVISLMPRIPTSAFLLLAMVQALVQGIMTGWFLNQNFYDSGFSKNMPFVLPGILLGYFSGFIPFEIPGSQKNTKDIFEGFLSLDNAGFLIILLFLVCALIYFALRSKHQDNSEPAIAPQYSKRSKPIQYAIIFSGLTFLILEIQFLFWSEVLNNFGQSTWKNLTFPVTVLTIFIYRKFLITYFSNKLNAGWVFVLAILSTISLGMFYTFSFSPLFIISFGISIAFLFLFNTRLYQIDWSRNLLCLTLIAGSLCVFVSGLFVQNFIEFAISIKIPEEFRALAARQGLFKEMATFAALATIGCGYLFIKRRTITY